MMKSRASGRTGVFAVAAVVAVFAVIPFAGRAATLYVDATATGTQDGSSSYPYRTIKQALDVAASGDTVHVAAGTYSPSTNGEQFPIKMHNNVIVEGEGPQTTILNAEGSARVVLYSSITNGATAIKKFMITGGNADRGGGIYCDSSSGMISNNFICYNSVSNAGAGIECRTSNPTIQNNVIWKNSAGDEGGGIDCDVQSGPTIVNNTIVDNHGDGNKGGGVNCDDGSCPLLINNIIHHNDGYGVFEEKTDSDPILKYNDLYDNGTHEYFDCTLGDVGIDMDSAAEINGLDSNVGNMVKNPRYLDRAAADFRLTLHSPCIDAGTNENAPSDDVLGRTRPYDVWTVDQNGSTTNYDIGAYEYEQNLVAPSGSFSPTHIILTQTLSLSATVTNAGDDTASPTQMQFYLCKSKSIASGTSYLLVTLDVPELAREAIYTAATSLALDGVPAGTYYVGWLVDSSNAVHEWDEANEFFASGTLTVDAINRDLAVTEGSFSPEEIRLGDTLWVNAWVENIGNWSADASVLEFYLSDDMTIDRSADRLLATCNVPALSPGGASYYLISAEIDNVAPRRYYIGWLADALNQVQEGDEANQFFADGSLLVRAGYSFDLGADGWTTQSAAPVFEPPLGEFTTGSLVLRSLTNTNTFGYWQSPAQGIKIIPGSLYLAQFTVSSEVTDRSRVPTVRCRVNTADAQVAHSLRVDSSGAGELSPSASPVLYNLYFASPSTLVGSAETTVSLSFDLLNFDPTDEAHAVVRLEGAELTRFVLADLSTPTDVRNYEFTFSAEDWAFTSVPSIFSAPVPSISEESLVLKALTNTDTFGYWASPTDDVVMDATERLFRATFSVRSDQADRTKVPTLRLRLYDSANQMTVEQMVSSSGSGANSPATSNEDYALYFLTRSEMDQRGLCAAFDMLNFSPDDTTSASLKLDRVGVQLLSIPMAP
jgi:hypothetical protein